MVFFVKVLDKDVEDCPVGPVMMDDVLDFVPPALDRLDELECVGRPICRNVFLPCGFKFEGMSMQASSRCVPFWSPRLHDNPQFGHVFDPQCWFHLVVAKCS